ncbi:monovalent cation/H+ antiporter complex subunit F [Leifsonia shinshuensis]
MSPVWEVAIGVLIVAGPLVGLVLAARGEAVGRLVGLQLAGVTTVMILVAVSVGDGQTSYLIVPLTLAVLLTTGTLVFTRLIRQRSQRIADAQSADGDGDGPQGRRT